MVDTIGNKRGIRRIAEAAGVSIATVSRMLNSSANVSDRAKKTVSNAITAHHYQPNAAAKALATNRTRTVAAVIPTLEHSIFAVFMNAMEDQLAAHGYSLVIATHQFDYDTELRRCHDVLNLGAEALIVSGAEHSPNLTTLLESTSIPCLYTSVYMPNEAVPTLGYDKASLANNAIQYLYNLGHPRVAVLHGPLNNNDRMRERVSGIKTVINQNADLHIELNEAPIGAEAGKEAISSWHKNNAMPQACLCLTDVNALGIVLGAHELGISIPRDISVMGFEDVDWSKHCTPALTTIALPTEQMGRQAADVLVSHLDDGVELEHRELHGSIIERNSTGRVPEVSLR